MIVPRPSATLRRLTPLGVLCALALAARLALMPLYAYLPGNWLDERFWITWMGAIHEHGILNVFRTTEANYVGYQWILWLLTLVDRGAAFSTGPAGSLHFLVKAPPVAFDLALIALVYGATGVLASPVAADGVAASAATAARGARLALAGAAVIAFQPAVLYDSAVWAQTDSIITVAMLAAVLLAARDHTGAAWSAWALGCAVKPQPLLLAPVLVVLTLRRRGGAAVLRGAGAAVLTVALVILPWALHGDLARVGRVYHGLMSSDYGRLSVSAWNGWWFADRIAHPTPAQVAFGGDPLFSYRMIGLELSGVAALLGAAYVWVKPDLRGALIAASFMAYAFFMLPVSTHERYLYPLVVLLLPVAAVERRWLWLYVPTSATLFLNMFVIAPSVHAWSGRWVDAGFITYAAGLNVALFVAFTAILVVGARPLGRDFRALVRSSYPFSRIGAARAEHTPGA